MRRLSTTLLTLLLSCLCAAACLLAPDAASARTPARQPAAATAPAGPQIDGFDVAPAAQLSPGTELAFTVYGTPGATATLALDGAQRRLALEETQVGVYEGVYTLGTRDKVTPTSRVTANLRLGNQVASAVLDEPLAAGAARTRAASAAAAGAPRIDRFEVWPPAALSGGNDIAFTLRGTPGGQASVTIPGARRLLLQETQPGVYAGSYTVRNADRIEPAAAVGAWLSVGGATATQMLDHALAKASSATTTAATPADDVTPPRATAAPRPAPRPVVAAAAAPCRNCATVVAVNPIEVKGPGSYVGPVASGLVGALVGSQFGGGSGQTLAGIAGAVGGAFAGRAIERRVRKVTHHEVVVRLATGSQRTFAYDSNPNLPVGTRVRIVDDRLVC